MNPEQWARVKHLFNAALDRTPGERAAFLADACRDSDDERLEVERLLAAHDDAGTFIERSPVGGLLNEEPRGPMTGRVLGQYRVGRLLGTGGMGAVYAAHDVELDRLVALKFVAGDSPQGDTSLRREARRASQLNHPNVCTIHQAGTADGTMFFVMEHVAGQTLASAIPGTGLPLDDLLNYAGQVAAALGHAHERGLVHRDLKSANVMLTPGGRIKVLDFGLAAPLASRTGELTQSHAVLTANEPIAGTLPYMAPELLLAKPADRRSDIWAFGVLLYEMAAGRRPFSGSTSFEMCAAILSTEPAPLPDRVPAPLRDLIARTLVKNREKRSSSVAELAASLHGMQVAAGAAPVPTGAWPAASSQGGRLPASRTSFVGRAEELLRFSRELESARMVTLTGVGGSGKTRLSLRMAEEARTRFRDGVWWVELAPLADGARVDEAVATVFGVLNSQRSPREAMLEWLAGRQLLLVVDNCEHVVAAVADLADALLTRAADLRILATSREGLGVPGERIVAVPSLSIPSNGEAADLQALARSDAVTLFVERAAAARPGFALTADTGPIVLDICRRLDGIPLGIELAAAHARVLSVAQIRERLKDRLTVLSGRTRAIPRHQTLGATLQWSYDLLTPAEQRALRLLSVFQGTWTLAAAAAVFGDESEEEVLDLLWRLVDKSLIQVLQAGGAEARYRLLEMVRQFAYERLVGAGEAGAATSRHAEFYIVGLERTVPDLVGPFETRAVAAIDQDLHNLLAAIDARGTLDRGIDRALTAAGRAWLFWVVRGYIALARSTLTSMLDDAAAADPLARAEALTTRSMCTRFAGDGTPARADAEAAVALIEALPQTQQQHLPLALFHRALTRLNDGADHESVIDELHRALALSRQWGDRLALGWGLNLLAVFAQRHGDLDRAETLLNEALVTAQTLRSPYLEILYRANLSMVYGDRGRWVESAALLCRAFELVRSTGNRHFACGSLLIAARQLLALGGPAVAMRLMAAGYRIGAEFGEEPPRDEVEALDSELRKRGVDPADEQYAASVAEGRTLNFDAAIADAIAALESVVRPAGA
jgi:non-specific serine/threonine protein kinase